MAEDKKMEKLVSLCKRRGFVFPNSEIYGGLANTYDYGPLGVELKNNIKQLWWRFFVQQRDDIVGIDGAILSKAQVFAASGHIENFKDALVECKKCHKRFRPDKLSDATRCPDCGGKFTKQKMFSGMFKTIIGPIEEQGEVTYLRPETAQNIFVDYKNVLQSTNVKIPFGIAQMGKVFRNEITTGNLIFRTLEFEQMEIEYFVNPKDDWNKKFEQWADCMHQFAKLVGLNLKKIHDVEVSEKDRAFYSQRTIDTEYEFPFGQDELWGLAYRGDYDLSNHQKHSGVDLTYFDAQNNERYLPHVIEPTFGVDRILLAILSEAYVEETLESGETRVVLKLKPIIAPYKVAVFPLLANKEKLVEKAREICRELKKSYMVFCDDRGNIGKRYRYQDEIGTPFCVTIDFDTLEKGTVTVRDRDTMKQDVVEVGKIEEYIAGRL